MIRTTFSVSCSSMFVWCILQVVRHFDAHIPPYFEYILTHYRGPLSHMPTMQKKRRVSRSQPRPRFIGGVCHSLWWAWKCELLYFPSLWAWEYPSSCVEKMFLDESKGHLSSDLTYLTLISLTSFSIFSLCFLEQKGGIKGRFDTWRLEDWEIIKEPPFR